MKKFTSLIAPILLLVSCEKALIDNGSKNDPVSNFESLWTTINEKYSFFEIKNIRWDSVYAHYAPMVNASTDDERLFNIMDSMLYDLRDGHVNLVSPFNLSRNWDWYLDFPENFDVDVIERNYLGTDHRRAGGLLYTIIDSIGYLYYESFSSSFSNANLDAVVNYFSGTKGVIIDVRNNGGGSLGRTFLLAQRFIPERRRVLITEEKTGPGPNDFGNRLTYSISPSSRGAYNGPVVVLSNRRCYSATNTFIGMMSMFDHVTIIGDQTGGGGGIPIDSELPNGWRYRFSASASYLPTEPEFNIEMGVPPDIIQNASEQNLANGTDDLLDRALDFLD